MKRVPSSYVRDNWARVMDDAVHEPIAVTSHGRTRVIIVNAALSEQVTGVVADLGLRVPDPPKYPWLDPSIPVPQRMELLRARKKEIHTRSMTDWTDEEIGILATDPWFLPEA